jgi:uncharacterized membrane protein YhaH (DUF805 family)
MSAVRVSRNTYVATLILFLAQPIGWEIVQVISNRLGINQQWRFDVLVSLALLVVLVFALTGRLHTLGRSPWWALAQGALLIASTLVTWWGFNGNENGWGWHPHLGTGSSWSKLLFLGGLAVTAFDLLIFVVWGFKDLARPDKLTEDLEPADSNVPSN